MRRSTTNARSAWDAALSIIGVLRDAGHRALLAGGCVRDRLLGRIPKDYDVATDARPERVRELFPKARMVGAKFGVMLVRKFGHDVEVATFRCDGEYSDGRRPDAIRFGDEIEDARRRDFTINGLFLDPADDRVIDHVGGLEDLKARVIRTIGDPRHRFAEDHLRMLRAVRLSARLGFPVEEHTADAVRQLATHLSVISSERIWMELEQILTEPTRAVGWSLLRSLGLRAHLSPAWIPVDHREELAGRRLSALPAVAIDAALALAALTADLDDAGVLAVCRSFRLSNRLTARTRWLVRNLPSIGDAESLDLADFKQLMVNGDWELLLELLHADLAARGVADDPLRRARHRAEQVAPETVDPAPLLGGEDLLALGVEQGPVLGEMLRALRRAQLNETVRTRDEAMRFVRERMRS